MTTSNTYSVTFDCTPSIEALQLMSGARPCARCATVVAVCAEVDDDEQPTGRQVVIEVDERTDQRTMLAQHTDNACMTAARR